jgi:glycosyltransferase involved in cell wall biosynthesis
VDSPSVSIILPVFNRLKYLRPAIASVRAQTRTAWELVIVDDGSDDETRSFLGGLDDARIRTELLAHSGNPSAVRNAGIRRARGRYLAFLDSDDLWVPHKLEVQLGMMQRSPERRWSYTKESFIDEVGAPVSDLGFKPWTPYEGNIVEPLLRIDALVSTCTVVAERSLVVEAGSFDEEQWFAEDYDLWLRLSMRGEVSASPEPLSAVRLYGDSYSADRVGAHEGWVRLYGKMAALVTAPPLRALCRRRQGESALVLAGLLQDRGETRAALRTLLGSGIDCWRDPRWCTGAAKSLLRPLVPRRVLAAYRRLIRGSPVPPLQPDRRG